jgi:hypothetical protein
MKGIFMKQFFIILLLAISPILAHADTNYYCEAICLSGGTDPNHTLDGNQVQYIKDSATIWNTGSDLKAVFDSIFSACETQGSQWGVDSVWFVNSYENLGYAHGHYEFRNGVDATPGNSCRVF